MSAHSAALRERHGPFGVAVFCTVWDVAAMADPAWLEEHFELLSRSLQIDKVYLETYRDGTESERETILAAKRFFESRGVLVSGGMMMTLASDGARFQSFCYSGEEKRRQARGIFERAASLFDELMLDDAFFANCACRDCIEAKGERSWSEFRLEQMRDVAENVVVKPARAVNPNLRLIIKYPNWYEHFPSLGYDLELEPDLFDLIYTGNETRDAEYHHQHLPPYLSYSIQRYFENVAPGRNGGAWIDPYERRTLDRYGEQITLALLAKPRELTLFCFGALLEPIRRPDGSLEPASRVAPVAADALSRAGAFLDELGEPLAIPGYKPHHSSGEEYLHARLGMLGIPLELTPAFPTDAQTIFLSESAAFDPEIVERIRGRLLAGGRVIVTSGLVRALHGRGFEQIAQIEPSDRRIVARRFSDFRGVHHASGDVLLPRLRYPTNDSWPLIEALGEESGSPLLLSHDYASGVLVVLTIPDDPGDLAKLPAEVLARIRGELTRGLFVRLEGPGRVCLFAYDNGAFVVHSFLPHPVDVTAVMDQGPSELSCLNRELTITGIRRGEEIAFPIHLEAYSYGAFRGRRP
ncbi:MAG: hypothetical protein ACXVY8_06135 [Gaiellaceae bacterium]